MGKLLRGSSKNARFFIVETKDIVQDALDIHKCSGFLQSSPCGGE